jgi:flagellar motor switch protein FliG
MVSSPNLRKAAILLASLPPDDAEKLLSQLDSKQVQALTAELIRLGRIENGEEESVCREFAAAVEPDGQRHHWSQMPPFSFLRHFDQHQLFTLLKDEHPQTVAVIVSYLPREQAVDFLAALPSVQQTNLIQRIATLGRVDRQIVGEVEIGLQSRLIKTLRPTSNSIAA